MAREDFKAVMLRKDLLAGLFTRNDQQTAEAAFLTELAADGMRYRFMQQGFRPPKKLIEALDPARLAVFSAMWADATETAVNQPGPLGSRFTFIPTPIDSEFAEPDTFLPVRTDIPGWYRHFYAMLRPLTPDELGGVAAWIERQKEGRNG